MYKQKGFQKWSVGLGITNELNGHIVPESAISFDFVEKELGGEYIADPFVVQKDGSFYLFVEHVVNNLGKLSAFKSTDFKNWMFCGFIVDEPFHMSYPQVIESKGRFYMVPECRKSNTVRLYQAIDFPTRWELKKHLLQGQYTDPTLFEHNGKVYMFTTDRKYFLRCFVSDAIDGSFQEHPKSPLGIGNSMRPAGTVIVNGDGIFLPVQNRRRGYGYSVNLLSIDKLTPQELIFHKRGKFLSNINHPLFRDGNHHVSHFYYNGKCHFAVDGRIGTTKAYWRFQVTESLRDNVYDFLTFIRMPRHFRLFD